MRRLNTRNSRTPSRKKEIIMAALSCFAELGFENTCIDDIRSKSGASTGSIYHHFTSKENLAAAVYLEGIRVYQSGFVSVLEKEPEAHEGIRALVIFHLSWVNENPGWARFLFQMRRADFMGTAEDEFERINADFFGRVSLWFGRHIRGGTIRRLPPDLYGAILLGSCQEYTRLFLAGRANSGPNDIAAELSDAVWRALGV